MARKKSEGAFPVVVTENAFDEGNAVLAETLKTVTGSDAPRVALVADANVVQRTEGLGTAIGRYFQANGIALAASPVVLPGSEKIKLDIKFATDVMNALLDAKVGSNDIVIALGGGAVLDVAGYAAAQVRGGVRVLRLPTTPLAMFGSSFTDWAAVDGAALKDALRVRSVPAAAIVDTQFAKTVLDGVWRAGFGEAVRYAAVCDGALVKRLAKRAEAIRGRDYEAMRESIAECIASRTGRAPTAFALWCAARLEAMSGYKLPHGYATAIAVCIDCAYAVKTGTMKESDQELVCRTLADCGALDGLSHSHYLLGQAESILHGLDAQALTTGRDAVELPAALGKSVEVERPDRAVYAEVIRDFLSVSRGE